MPLIDIGKGEPLVFVPILEHLEFVYARQVRAFSKTRRVIMYRRHETRTQPVGLVERAEELRQVLDSLGLEAVDLVAHGDFFFNDTATTEIYTLSLHDALPI